MTEVKDCVRLVHTLVAMASSSGVGGGVEGGSLGSMTTEGGGSSSCTSWPWPLLMVAPRSLGQPLLVLALKSLMSCEFVFVFVLCSTWWVILKHYAHKKEENQALWHITTSQNTTQPSQLTDLSLQPVHKSQGNKRELYRGTGQIEKVVIASTLVGSSEVPLIMDCLRDTYGINMDW